MRRHSPPAPCGRRPPHSALPQRPPASATHVVVMGLIVEGGSPRCQERGPLRRELYGPRVDPAEAAIYDWFANGTGNNGDGEGDGLACE